MKARSTLKRLIYYILVVVPIACLQQEIQPQPDQNTRACQLNNIITYRVVPGSKGWSTQSEKIDYNDDGNPVKWTVYAYGFTEDRRLEMKYDGTRLTRMNHYANISRGDITLTEYNTYDIDANFNSITEHGYEKDFTGKFTESRRREFLFFRKENGIGNKDLRLGSVKIFTKNLGVFADQGDHKRFEYDGEDRNLSKIYSYAKEKRIDTLSYEGFDVNSRSPWNANFWLSFIQDYIEKSDINGESVFHEAMGYWSENNLSIEKKGKQDPLQYNIYELNEQGFTCISSIRRSDGIFDSLEKLWYYNNCECRKR